MLLTAGACRIGLAHGCERLVHGSRCGLYGEHRDPGCCPEYSCDPPFDLRSRAGFWGSGNTCTCTGACAGEPTSQPAHTRRSWPGPSTCTSTPFERLLINSGGWLRVSWSLPPEFMSGQKVGSVVQVTLRSIMPLFTPHATRARRTWKECCTPHAEEGVLTTVPHS